jgi:hypothetical protein
MEGQKRPQIVFSDPDNAIHTVYGQMPVFDPSPDCPARNIDCFSHRFDSMELRQTTALTATIDNDAAGAFRNFVRPHAHDERSRGSRTGEVVPPDSNLFRSGWRSSPTAGSCSIQARKSPANTRVRRPRFTARSSPVLIAS